MRCLTFGIACCSIPCSTLVVDVSDDDAKSADISHDEAPKSAPAAVAKAGRPGVKRARTQMEAS